MTGPTPKYGRRAPSRRPALSLSRALTGKIPAHPAAADYLATLGATGRCSAMTRPATAFP
jgi:hypothetical protein